MAEIDCVAYAERRSHRRAASYGIAVSLFRRASLS
jgi:hypothetical protein